MSTARHHAEWLSLVETSGPFLSMPVLTRVFPQGLDPRDTERSSRLREAYEEWLDSGQKPAMHHAWIRHVLCGFLGYEAQFLAEGQGIPAGIEASMANYGETLRPDFILKRPGADEKPVLLIGMHPAEQDLNKPVPARVWKASPATRMMELLHATNIPVGLVTNGEQWMLVFAPRGETTGFASWYADLWMQEPITLRAFHSLLQQRRFMGVADGETLPALLAESSEDQQEVTDQLGLQVRHAVEMLVRALDRLDEESGRQLLREVSEKDLYNGALTVMMRLVFLFSAEERGLLLLGDPLYDQHYAVSTLSQLLRERADQHGEEVLERRQDAWCRLLSTFRGVHGGIEHEALRLPPYGGTLFDPDRFPFLEGREPGTTWRVAPAKPLAINNRVVLHLLESLQVLRVKVPGGGPAETRRLSFRALDIEQIGHVYEGLLDHTAKRASAVMLGLAGGRGREPEIALSRLEELAGFSGGDLLEPEFSSSEPHLLAAEATGTVVPMPRATGSATYQPEAKLIEFLNEETGRSEKALIKALTEPAKIDRNRLFLACGRDRVLFDRVSRFAGLLRSDEFDQPVVIRGGSVFVTSGSDRRSTGTHYTPRSLTEPIVQHTLEPLVYTGPAEGKPKAEWQLKSPREILALKVCDMTMGSGAFLVQTCRYLAERLVEAWENAERANPGKILATPEGDFSSGDPKERLIPADPAERLAIARRYVADRCLYGVDINPMAVEMAKLSLWLITLQRDRPFNFLDHALKCGDSLLGVSALPQIENFSLRPGERQVTFATANLFRYVEQAGQKRRELEDLPSNDHTQIETKNRLHAEAEAATAKVKAVADCLIAFELRGLDGDAYADARVTEADQVQRLLKQDADAALKSPISNQPSALAAHAKEQLRGRHPFHWPLEFPEVFKNGGFDAFAGNPPFLGGVRITEVLGVQYNKYLVANTEGANRKADLCCYFFRRAGSLVRDKGLMGLIATNSITQGLNMRVALHHLCGNGFSIYMAWSSLKWPGSGAVEVSVVHFRHGNWEGPRNLDGNEVTEISPALSAQTAAPALPLQQNEGRVYAGPFVYGDGFLLTEAEAKEMIAASAENAEVILPYLIGQDINGNPQHKASRFVVAFEERTEAEAQKYTLPFERLKRDVFPIRNAMNPPPRDMRVKTQWWKFFHPRLGLIEALKKCDFVCARSQVSTHHAVAIIPSKLIPSHFVIVFLGPTDLVFPLVQSAIHEEWVWKTASSLGGFNNTRYIQRDCFLTFPFPAGFWDNPMSFQAAASAGRNYNQLRQEILITRQEGLTKTYNRFHDRGEASADIARLRALHVELDQAVAAAYGWRDLDLGHGFHATKQGERYTLSEPARRTVLDRLLALNHRRYAEEVAAGLHEKGAKRNKGRKAKVSEPDLNTTTSRPQMDLL
jgi:hypothetical protein